MNFMTLLFAFLTMVYFIGEKLRAAEAWLVSVMYSLLAVYLILTVDATYGVLQSLLADFRTQFPEEAARHYAGRGAFREIVAAVLMMAWVVSLGFLFTTRRKPLEGAT